MTETVESLKAQASQHFANAEESFQRCDTDGFLSQWASGLNGQLCQQKAEILANGGMAEFWGLFDLEGKRLNAKMIDGKYGTCWAFMDENGKFTGKFVPFCNAAGDKFAAEGAISAWGDDDGYNARKIAHAEKSIARWNKKHGCQQLREMAPAMAYITGSGHGLSGRAWVAVKRIDGK